MSIERTSARSAPIRPSASSTRASAPRSTGGSPRNSPRMRLVLERVDQVLGVAARERRRGERDVAERLREDAAQPEHHARPELRIAHQPGDHLAPPAHHPADEHARVAVVGPARGEQRLGGRAHGRGVVEARAAPARARSCARSCARTASARPESPGRGRLDRGVRALDQALVGDRDPGLRAGAASTRVRTKCRTWRPGYQRTRAAGCAKRGEGRRSSRALRASSALARRSRRGEGPLRPRRSSLDPSVVSATRPARMRDRLRNRTAAMRGERARGARGRAR